MPLDMRMTLKVTSLAKNAQNASELMVANIQGAQREAEHLQDTLLIREFVTLRLRRAVSHTMTSKIKQPLNIPLNIPLNGRDQMGLIHMASISGLNSYQIYMISSNRACPISHFPAI